MRRFITTIAIGSAIANLMIANFAQPSRTAGGCYFYWAATEVNTNSLGTCFKFADDVMRVQGFQNIRRAPQEVTGSKGGVYGVITCTGTTPRATAVVMAVGDNDREASAVRDLLREKMHGIAGL